MQDLCEIRTGRSLLRPFRFYRMRVDVCLNAPPLLRQTIFASGEAVKVSSISQRKLANRRRLQAGGFAVGLDGCDDVLWVHGRMVCQMTIDCQVANGKWKAKEPKCKVRA